MSEFLSRLGGAALNQMKGAPLDRILNGLMEGRPGLSGLQALLKRLRDGGLHDQVESWVGPGQNQPVTAEQLGQALGEREAAQLARQGGMEPQGLLALLAGALPMLVNALTPEGRLPADDEGLHQAAQQAGFGSLLASVTGRDNTAQQRPVRDEGGNATDGIGPGFDYGMAPDDPGR